MPVVPFSRQPIHTKQSARNTKRAMWQTIERCNNTQRRSLAQHESIRLPLIGARPLKEYKFAGVICHVRQDMRATERCRKRGLGRPKPLKTSSPPIRAGLETELVGRAAVARRATCVGQGWWVEEQAVLCVPLTAESPTSVACVPVPVPVYLFRVREALVVGISECSVEQSSASCRQKAPGVWQRRRSRAATLCETWPGSAIQTANVAQSHTIWLGARAAVPVSVRQREVQAFVATTSAGGARAEGGMPVVRRD